MKLRGIRLGERVKVYRNLTASKKKKCKIYSVMNRKGRVIAHVKQLILTDVAFVIRKTGQRKVRELKRKNVHAFVVGKCVASAMGIDATGSLPRLITYNPYQDDTFIENVHPLKFPVASAMACVLNQNGVSAAYCD